MIQIKVGTRAAGGFWDSLDDNGWDSICQHPGEDDYRQGPIMLGYQSEERAPGRRW